MPLALYALAVATFAIGTTEFVIVGLIPEIATDLGISIPKAGLLVSLYALSITLGTPIVSALTGALPPAIGDWAHGTVHDLQFVCRRLPKLHHTAALTYCHGGCSRGLLRCRCGLCKFSCSKGKGRQCNRRDDGRAHRRHGGRGTARFVDRPII